MPPEVAVRHRFTLIAAFAAIYLIWGSTYLAIAFAIHSIPPLFMAAGRFLLAGSALYLWARLRGAPRPRPVQWGWAFFLGGLFFLVGNGAVVWVEQTIPSGLVALIVAMVSVWTALLEWLRPGGARPPGMVLAGILLGFLGVALLVLPAQGGAGHAPLAGVLLLMCSTFAWALASVLSRTADLPDYAPQVSGMEMLAGGVLLLLASLLHGDHLPQVRFRAGEPILTADELDALHDLERLVDSDDADLVNGVALSVDLSGANSDGFVGYRAKRHTGLVDVDPVADDLGFRAFESGDDGRVVQPRRTDELAAGLAGERLLHRAELLVRSLPERVVEQQRAWGPAARGSVV